METTRKGTTLFAILGVIIFTITAHILGWLGPGEDFLRRIFSPVMGKLYVSQVKNLTQQIATSTEGWQSMYQLTNERLLTCQAKVVNLELITEENEALRQQLTFFSKEKLRHVGADVVGRLQEPITNAIIINRGESDGLKRGDPVLVSAGILVGKISRVEEHFAFVQLLTDSQSKVAGTVLNREKSIGVVEGGYDISIQMNLIPQNEIVTVGDMVMSSGLETGMPRGLLIGVIEAVKKEAYQPFQQAILTPAAPLDKLTVVSVLIATSTSSPPSSFFEKNDSL